jgi:5-(aminomethyl)-3-furanmethanol phosphate kinase
MDISAYASGRDARAPEAVIKIGGSLSRGSRLPELCLEISRIGATHPLLIVPGGGKFADQAREAYRKFHLTETAAHRMALLSMDQYGYVLNHLIENSHLTVDPLERQPGRVSVLLPSAMIFESDPLPHSWEVTSDTIAAWVAQQIGCPQLVLVKDVDGLMTSGNELIEEMSLEMLAQHSGGVDEHFHRFLSQALLETWIINGTKPERLSELLTTGLAIGTKIIGVHRGRTTISHY